jgi:hypothetical protein
MRNSPRLPLCSLVLAVLLAAAAVLFAKGDLEPLSELQLGALAGAMTFAIFGVQGLISVNLEGQELRPGMIPPHLTDQLSRAILLVSLLLLIDSVVLGAGIVNGWSTTLIGVPASLGCILLAALLVFYKEAFLGSEACFDEREDGTPW